MGTQQGDNGGSVPPEGNHDQSSDDPVSLPELPPEWGEITIPDDLSELAEEAEQIRQELAEQRGHPAASWRPDRAPESAGEPSIGVPLLIMSVAVLITLVSLFAMAWSGSGEPDRTGTGPDTEPAGSLPGVTLTDAAGHQVPLVGQAPMAILLVEECEDCAGLIADTAAQAPSGVTVAAVGTEAPRLAPGADPGDAALLLLADPNRVLRTELGLSVATNAATVVLVGPDDRITHTVPAATAVGQFQTDLADLAA